MTTFILIAILALINATRANIYIGIVADANKANIGLQYSGEDTSTITAGERSIFNLTDENILLGIYNYHQGVPRDVFLHDPTGNWNLFNQYNWRPTTVVVSPVVANVLDVASEPIAVLTQTFTNDHPTLSANFNVQLTQQIQNTVRTSWSRTAQVGSTSSINFGVQGFGAGGSITFGSTWGQASDVSETVVIGTAAGMQITLGPGESVVAELVATRGSIVVDIDYEARLMGRVVGNYPKKHLDSHFWAYDVNTICEAAELPDAVVTNTQTVNVGFFSEGNIRLYDGRTRKILASVPVQIKQTV